MKRITLFLAACCATALLLPAAADEPTRAATAQTGAIRTLAFTPEDAPAIVPVQIRRYQTFYAPGPYVAPRYAYRPYYGTYYPPSYRYPSYVAPYYGTYGGYYYNQPFVARYPGMYYVR